jgi:hypothetical protein
VSARASKRLVIQDVKDPHTGKPSSSRVYEVCEACGTTNLVAEFRSPDHRCNAEQFVEMKERGDG